MQIEKRVKSPQHHIAFGIHYGVLYEQIKTLSVSQMHTQDTHHSFQIPAQSPQQNGTVRFCKPWIRQFCKFPTHHINIS